MDKISPIDKEWLIPRDAWDKLSIPEKTVMLKAAVSEGIYDLNVIRQKYNEFAEGGSVEVEEEVNTNQFKEGGGIHIKPSHRGRLTELKARTGKSEAELYNDGNPAHKKMVVFARNARKWHAEGGNLFYPGGGITYGQPFYSYDDNGKLILDNNGKPIVNYNASISDIVIIPDSKKSPADRNADNRYRQRTQRDYAEQSERDYTQRQIIKAQKDWDNSTEKKALNYAQAATSGIGVGADIVSGLPIYSSLKGARILNEAETPIDYIESGLWLSPIGGVIGKEAANTGKQTIMNILDNNPAIGQYARYGLGKFKYGFDAELPTLYRKVKTLPKIEDGKLVVSNPNSRFAYDNGFGTESPIITNMTTDAPVRSHGAGNWDRGLTLAFPGKTLLGKNVISTRPSDTFTFGDNISVPINKVTAFSGRPKEINFMQDAGIKTVTSPEAELFWQSGASDLANKVVEARQTIQKINAAKNAGNRMILLKPKTPIENFSNYSRTIEDLTRETFKSPTAKDYHFMDYVFKPKYSSETMPVVEDITIKALNEFPLLGEWAGNVERLRYLGDPSRWSNLMYDPLTSAESEFRDIMNIGLKPEYKK